MSQPPSALVVVSLESRREQDMASLLERRGLTALRAPSMREVPLSDQTEALAFGDTLFGGELDLMVFLTGVGARSLVDALATRHSHAEVLAALGRVPIACRGPKPVAVLKEWGLRAAVVAPVPNTYVELLAALDSEWPVAGKRVAVQEYGQPNPAFMDGLRERGAQVRAVPIYAWQLPEDTGPLRAGIEALVGGRANAVAFTSQQQVHNLFDVARTAGLEDALLAALQEQVLVGSIGPITSAALRHYAVEPDIEPQVGKMGHLVKYLAEQGPERLTSKRAGA